MQIRKEDIVIIKKSDYYDSRVSDITVGTKNKKKYGKEYSCILDESTLEGMEEYPTDTMYRREDYNYLDGEGM